MDAWQVGVLKHLDSLPPAERAAFMAPATVEDCMDRIQVVRHRNRQSYHKMIEAIAPLIEPLQRFQGAIDVVCQVYPLVTAPVWGPIRAVIMLASDRLATLQTLGRFLERLVEPLKRFQTYENVFRGNPTLRNAIGALYCDLIDFCSRAIRFYGKSSVRTVFGSFDKDFQELSDSIRFHWTEIDVAANCAHIIESSEIRRTEELRRQAQLHGDIQRWLAPATFADDVARHRDQCMDGSCDWFLRTKEMVSRQSSATPYSIRIKGRPGQGKTILSSWIVTTYIQRAQGLVLYFFCKAGDPEKKTALHVMRTLLSQFLRAHEEQYWLIERFYQHSGRPVADSYTEVHQALMKLLSHAPKGPINVIIDAVDECSEAQALIDALKECQSAASSPLHLILTSRDNPNLGSMFQFVDETICFPPHITKQAIRTYVSRRIQRFDFAKDRHLVEELTGEVTRAAEGLWLYARLALDELARASSASEARNISHSLPEGLRSLYTTMLKSSESRFSETEVQIGMEIFIWIDGADFMPWWHFHSDDILEENALTVLIKFANGGENVFDPMRKIQRLCFPLVNVFHTTAAEGGEPYAAKFVHYSAEQYIQWSSNADKRRLPRLLQRRKLRRLFRAVTAAWYFTSSEDFCEVLKQLRNDPYGNGFGAYFEMAYGMGDSWHMPNLPDNLDQEDEQVIAELCKRLTQYIQTTQCVGWAEAAILINYAGGFTNLLENVQKAVKILTDRESDKISIPAWNAYVEARRVFFTDLIYILKITGPGYKAWDSSSAPMPDGFEGREVAMSILALGKRYQHYVDEAPKLTGLAGVAIDPDDVVGRNSVTSEWERRRSSSVAPSTSRAGSVLPDTASCPQTLCPE